MVLGWRKKGGELGLLLQAEDTEAAHLRLSPEAVLLVWQQLSLNKP